MIINSDIGTTSNMDGCFYLDDLSTGKYSVLINYIGYYDESYKSCYPNIYRIL